MKCYYTYDNDGEKHLIPMCWDTLHSDDISDCTCREPNTSYNFEKQRFNEVVKEKNRIIQEQQAELEYLRNMLEK